jgi:hypothetical protein
MPTFDSGEHADDIDDGIDAADFVQVDLVHGHAVDAALDLADAGEDTHRALLDVAEKCASFDDLADVARWRSGAWSWAWTSTLVAPKPFLETLLMCRWKSSDVQFGEFRLECGGGQSGIDERAEQHVAAGTRDAVEIGGFHRV